MPRLSGQPFQPEGPSILDESGYMVEPAGWRKREGATGRKARKEREDTGKKSLAPGLSQSDKIKAAIAAIAEKSGVNLPAYKGGPSRRAEPPIPGKSLGGLSQRDRIVAALAARQEAQTGTPLGDVQAPGKEAPTRLQGRSRRFPDMPRERAPKASLTQSGHPQVSFTPRKPVNARITDEKLEYPIGAQPKDLGQVEGEAYGKFGTDDPAPFANILEEKRKARIEEDKLEREIHRQKWENKALQKNVNFEEGESLSPALERERQITPVDVENPIIGEGVDRSGTDRSKKRISSYLKRVPESAAEKVRAFLKAHPKLGASHATDYLSTQGPGNIVKAGIHKKAQEYNEGGAIDEGYDESQAGDIALSSLDKGYTDTGSLVGALSDEALLGGKPTSILGSPLAQQGQEAYSGFKTRVPSTDVRGLKKRSKIPMSAERAKELAGSGAPVTVAQRMRKIIASNPRMIAWTKSRNPNFSKIPSEKKLEEANKPAGVKPSGKRKLTAGDPYERTSDITKTIAETENKELTTPYGGGTRWSKAPEGSPYGHGATTVKPSTGLEHHASREQLKRIAKLAKDIQKEKNKEAQSRRIMAINKARRGNG